MTQTAKSLFSSLTHAFARYIHCKCDAKCITNARTIRNCTNGRNVNMSKPIQITIKKCPNGLEIRQTPAGAFFLPLRLSMIFVQLFKIHYKRKGSKQPRSAPLSPAQPRRESANVTFKKCPNGWGTTNLLLYTSSTSWAALTGAVELCESCLKSIARQRSEIASEPSIGPCLRPQIMEIPTFSSFEKSVLQEIFIIGDNNRHATYIESCPYISSVFPESLVQFW